MHRGYRPVRPARRGARADRVAGGDDPAPAGHAGRSGSPHRAAPNATGQASSHAVRRSSEKLDAAITQLELALEDLEEEQGAQEAATPAAEPPDAPGHARPARRPLPDHLPRHVVEHATACECPACGGTLRRLGEDVTEVLDYVPASFRVVRHVRPKFSCRQCETITQAPAPSLPIRRGRAGPGLLAHVLVAKFCDHLPLYRQSEIYAREGVDVERSTLAD